MAKMALFVENLAAPALKDLTMNFVESLAAASHTIKIFTSYPTSVPLPSAPKNVEILTPFKKWNLREALALMPHLVSFQPDAIHLVQPFLNESLFHPYLTLLPALRSLLSFRLHVTYFELNRRELKQASHRRLLRACDYVWVTDKNLAHWLSSDLQFTARALTMPLPVSKPEPGPGETPWFVFDPASHLLYVPGAMSDLNLSDQIWLSGFLHNHRSCKLFLAEGWGRLGGLQKKKCRSLWHDFDVGPQWVVIDGLNEDHKAKSLLAAALILAAPLGEGSLSVSCVLHQSRLIQKVVLLSPAQAYGDSFEWQDEVNGFIGHGATGPGSWRTRLHQLISEPQAIANFERSLPQVSSPHDLAANLISRSYVLR